MDTIKNTIGNAMEAVGDAMGSEHHSQHQSTPYRHSIKTEHAPVAVLDVRTGNESHTLASGKTTCSCNGNLSACACPPGTCGCAGCGQGSKKAGPMKGMGTRPLDQETMSSSKMSSGVMGSSERVGGGNEGCRVMGRGECDCEPGTCEKGATSKGGMSSRGMSGGMSSGQSSMSGQMGQGAQSYASMAGKGKTSTGGGADQIVLNRD